MMLIVYSDDGEEMLVVQMFVDVRWTNKNTPVLYRDRVGTGQPVDTKYQNYYSFSFFYTN